MIILKEDLENPKSIWLVDLQVRTNAHIKTQNPQLFTHKVLPRMVITGLDMDKLNGDFVTICSAEKYAKLSDGKRGIGALKIIKVTKS